MDIVFLVILFIFVVGLLGIVFAVIRMLFDILFLKDYSILYDPTDSENYSNDTNRN